MAHKTRINGTNYGIKGGKCRVNGTNYSIKKGRTLVGGTGYDILFTKTLGNMAVGESVYLNESGSPVEFLIVHKGNPSTSIYDSSCNGIWLLRKDGNSDTTYWLKNGAWPSSAGYAESVLHTYLQETYLARLDQAVQNGIVTVKIPYCNYSGTAYTGSNGLSAKVFGLSAVEVGFNNSSYNLVDGVKLSYFTAGDTTSARAKRSCTTGSAGWWTRTPKSTSGACLVTNNGAVSYGSYTYGQSARPALILPADTIVQDDGLITMQ